MKRGIFTLALVTSIFAISCSKNDAELAVLNESGERPAAAAMGNFVSGWETIPSWQSSTSNGVTLFSFKRSTPQLSRPMLEKGAVVVWTKGYDFEGVTKGDKPLGMPFTWIPADEKYMYPYIWSYQVSEKNVAVGVQMHSMMEPIFTNSKDAIWMRFFVLSEDFLTAHGMSRADVGKLTYDKLVSMLNVQP